MLTNSINQGFGVCGCESPLHEGSERLSFGVPKHMEASAVAQMHPPQQQSVPIARALRSRRYRHKLHAQSGSRRGHMHQQVQGGLMNFMVGDFRNYVLGMGEVGARMSAACHRA